MRKKLLKAIILTVNTALLCVCIVLVVQMLYMQKKLVGVNETTGNVVEGMSADAMGEQTTELLSQTSIGRAELADNEFSEFAEDVSVIADSLSDIYASMDSYGDSYLKEYDASDMGKLAAYAAYGDGVDPEDAQIQEEVRKISNVQGMMISVNEASESMYSNYFATKTGIFLGVEPVSEYTLPVDGMSLSFEARQRPWYTEAVATGTATFTGMIKDADTGAYAITCGVPVYKGEDLMGVAGAGMYLDTLRSKVDSYRVGENGYACVINDRGQVLFSGADSGELAATDEDDMDVRNSSNTELADMVKSALLGDSSVRMIALDGANYYVACAPMKTVGWSYFVVLPEQEVLAPTESLMKSLGESNEKQTGYVRSSILSTILYMVILVVAAGLAAAFVSGKLAKKLVAPVVKLTDSVRDLEGDKLDFTWDMDTGDEVQTLAKSFESMTGRMKQYIKDITEITAEKERIGAELSVATHIQASMLPCIFPPFPDKKEFDLYASMDPAKEVGGDFYDFFLVDPDHLAIVIADVSGKGVPAALFMVIAKTLIKNHAQAGESVEEVLMNSNDQLCEGNGEGLFVTAWIGIIDLKTGNMKFCDAGHEYPYIMHEDGSFLMLKPEKKKPPLAAMEGMKYLPNEINLNEGDCILLYTDGVPEATNADNELYSTDRLEEVIKVHYADDPETLLASIRADVDRFVSDAPQFDDLTMLALKIHLKEALKNE
ncbi:MAG: SpoIIE family protein phosphatase [Lachnospiraceae bacterium]|nr:SpoIIE family protein phosphatase [Lachnospiraceae bacterium]